MDNQEAIVKTMEYPIITPEQFSNNYNFGLANASPYISKKQIRGKDFHYLSWAFAMRWLGSHYPYLQVHFRPEEGSPDSGYYCRAYILNTRNNAETPEMELAILDFSNKVICSTNEKNPIPMADDICNTRQRCRVKVIATYLGMGLHLYEGYGDVLSSSSSATEEMKETAKELAENNNEINEQIKIINNFKKKLLDTSLENYVEQNKIVKTESDTLRKYSLEKLADLAIEQKHYYAVCKIQYLLDKYNMLSPDNYVLSSKKPLEEWSYKELVDEGKKLNNLISNLETPGNE